MSRYEELAGNPVAAYVWRSNGPHGTGYQFYAANHGDTDRFSREQPGQSLVSSINPLAGHDSTATYGPKAYHEAGIVERVVMAPYAGKAALGYSLMSVGYGPAADATLEGINRQGTPIAVAAAMEQSEAEALFAYFQKKPVQAREYASYLLLDVLGTGRLRSSDESSFEGFEHMHFSTQARQSPHEGSKVLI
jgi:hypothetical protein